MSTEAVDGRSRAEGEPTGSDPSVDVATSPAVPDADADAAAHAEAHAEAHAAAHAETTLAISNGIKLGMSLVATLVVAITVRFWIPRFLGPEVFGQLHFAEAFAVAFFLLTSFGIDNYIGKEVATRPGHAEEFLGGLILVRALTSVLVVGLMTLALGWMGKGQGERTLAWIFALWQLFFVLNTTLAALLQARGTVDELSLANAGSKLVWGGAIAVGLLLDHGATYIALCFVASEALKTLYVLPLALRRLGIRVRFNLKLTLGVLLASFPYWLNVLAHRIYDRIDVQMLSVLTTDEEVGWYGASANLALLGLLFLPVVNAVVLPMGARLGELSRDTLDEAMKMAVRLVIVGGGLVTLFLALHADDLVRVLFGPGYEGSARSLQMLSPVFLLTYLAVIGSIHLMQVDRVWTVTRISIVGLVLNPTLNYFAIPWAHAYFGAGGGGAGAAFASMATELTASALTLGALGRSGVDGRLVKTVGVVLLGVALAVGVHVSLEGVFTSSLGPIPTRLIARSLVEGVVFVALVTVTGVLPVRDILRRFASRLGR